MSIHIAPIFRAREDAMQKCNLIAPLNSDGYLELKYQEDLGATFRQSPKCTYLFDNISFYPSTLPPNT